MNDTPLLIQDISFHTLNHNLIISNKQLYPSLKMDINQQNIQIQQNSLLKVPTIKSAQISLSIRQLVSVSSIFMQKTKNSQNNENILTNEQQQIKTSNNRLNQNLFQGQNPGLFYSYKSAFDKQSKQSTDKFVSIQNLPHKDLNQEFNKLSNNNSVKKITHKQQQISGKTIIDTETQQQFEQITFKQTNKLIRDQNQSKELSNQEQDKQKVFRKSNPSHFYIPQNKPNKHSKHCHATARIQRQRQFVVPIIINRNKNNKSKYISNQYRNINDQNLTNFFTTKDKQIFVDKFNSKNLINNVKQLQSHNQQLDNKQRHSKYFHSNHNNGPSNNINLYQINKNQCSNNNKFQQNNKNNIRASTVSNFNYKSGCLDFQFQPEFKKVNNQNTKFLIKTLPSQKNKKFFNQSLSTLINYNYRPMTSRKRPIKTVDQKLYKKQTKLFSTQYTNKNLSEQFFKQIDQNFISETKQPKQMNLSCDFFAQANSFKKMNQNTKKGKKICFIQKPDNKSIQISQVNDFIKQSANSNINLQNCQQIRIGNNQKLTQSNYSSSNSSLTQNKNLYILNGKQNQQFLLKQQSVSKYQNMAQIQMQMIKNNNIKRVKHFQRKVMSKLNIVSKMGVKVTQF